GTCFLIDLVLQEKQQSLSIPSTDKLSVRRRSRLSSINTLFGTPRNSFDSTMMLRSTNQEKQQSLSIPSTDKLSVRRRSRLSSINTLFGTPRNSFDSTMMLRSTNQEKILSAKKKVTRMLMTIVAAFAVCWLPSHLWWLLVRASDLAVSLKI
ncbi:hypothetical protein COOONC_09574, partial [Cooperia oncophora]